MEWPLIYDIRARPFKITSPTGTRDLQMVDIGLRILYRPDPGAIPSIAKNVGEGKKTFLTNRKFKGWLLGLTNRTQ